MHPQQEIPVMEVKLKLLGELESLGFPRARAVRALHHSGNTTVEAAVNWLVDHENDAEIDQMPLVTINMDIESPQASDITEAIKTKEQELRDRVRINKREEEKKREREREKERIRAGKELLEAKRIAEENERQRLLAFRKAEKEEEKRAREKVLQKLELDKSERKRALGLPLTSQAVKPSAPIIQEKKLQNSLPVKSVKKADRMRECLRSLKHTYRGDNARVKRAYQTLLIYVGNVARSPDEEKYRKIRLSNPKFQERVGNLKGGIEFLELCGFERSEGNDFLVFPREKVDIELLNSADSLLKSAITNPFFGLLEHVRED
ncbi:UBX domain-containing protein 1-like isoform X2 [Durio zibethinus]|uniref:UBX domain-containing protein 1-like isoform X2 n=1 Tax=Durio zibethinus TaxID=66656 RepID=A0A6P6B2X9_DURZI|nr:UBX domain-containing protein 1-like isoform X2 [Durio zibethinus]